MKLILNVTDENSELLTVITVDVTDDKDFPLGSRLEKASIMADIEDSARTIQARASKGYYDTKEVA